MQSKAEGVPTTEEAEAPKEAEVVDLVAALRASVEAAKKRRQGAERRQESSPLTVAGAASMAMSRNVLAWTLSPMCPCRSTSRCAVRPWHRRSTGLEQAGRARRRPDRVRRDIGGQGGGPACEPCEYGCRRIAPPVLGALRVVLPGGRRQRSMQRWPRHPTGRA